MKDLRFISFALFLMVATPVFFACGDDDDDDTSTNPTANPDTGDNNDVYEVFTECPDANHPHMIDLGLPSGTKWACCNVGASAPEQYGNYYAWGETQPKEVYSWDTYQYGSSLDNVVYIGSDIAGTAYDAATANWGAPWRMPSLAQCHELEDDCTSTWTTQNGIDGQKFTGPNGGTIFLPHAGYCLFSEQHEVGLSGRYWLSTLYGSFPEDALYLLNSGRVTPTNTQRYIGLSVRPVH